MGKGMEKGGNILKYVEMGSCLMCQGISSPGATHGIVAEVDALQKRFNDLGKGFNGPR